MTKLSELQKIAAARTKGATWPMCPVLDPPDHFDDNVGVVYSTGPMHRFVTPKAEEIAQDKARADSNFIRAANESFDQLLKIAEAAERHSKAWDIFRSEDETTVIINRGSILDPAYKGNGLKDALAELERVP